MGITFQPNEVLAFVASYCLNAFLQSKGVSPEVGNVLEAVTEGTIKGFSLPEKPSSALDHLRDAITQSIEQALQTADLDYMNHHFKNLLLEQAFSPQALRDYLTSENPSAKLEEAIRAAVETSGIYDENTLPIPKLANSLLKALDEAIQNDPVLIELATFYFVQEMHTSLARRQSVSDFERTLFNMRPASEFRSPNPLHYLNKDLTFQGRAEEFHWLDQFRDSPQPLLYAFVQGGGGVGKSRLLHEYVIRRRDDGDWHLCFLSGQAVETLLQMDSYVCSRHAFLVIDYAGQYAAILGKWISRLAETQNPPRKIRVILIERQTTRESLRLGPSEFWISRFYGSSHQERVLQEVEYGRLTLQQLDRSALLRLMDDYSLKVAKKEPLSEEVKEGILRRVQTELGIEPEHQTPLFVLLATDAFLSGGSIKNWDIYLLTKNYVGRMLEHWEKTLCGSNTELYCSLRRTILFATASGGMDLNAAAAPALAEDVDRILQSPACREILENSSGLCGDLMLPLKPDYIGEFLFLQYLNSLLPLVKRQSFLNALYVKPMEFAAFFAKCVQDFTHAEMFRPLFQNILDAIRPTCPTAESYAAYASIVMSISMTCEYEEIKAHAADLEKLLGNPLMKESAYFLYTGLCFLRVLLHMTYIDGYDVIPRAEFSRIVEQRKASIPPSWKRCGRFAAFLETRTQC